MHRIEVRLKDSLNDPRGQDLVQNIADLGIHSDIQARVIDVYWLNANLTQDELESLGRQLFCDPVTQDYCYDEGCPKEDSSGCCAIEVAYNAGVTDPVEVTIVKAAADLGITLAGAKTARCYLISGNLTAEQLENISNRLLVNPIVQHVVTGQSIPFPQNPRYELQLRHIDLLAERLKDNFASLSAEYGLSRDEMGAIWQYFLIAGRRPTDAELETLAQTWSEHCVHKTFKALITLDGRIIDNLLKSTIVAATQELNKPWCLSVFEDNSGVIEFDDNWAVCFKVETHNHPSAVEPYGGAATGIGGVIRDILGTGLSAKPIANTDVFCFGPPNMDYAKLPPGVLYPRRVFKGVRAGVADYGNRLGIPTLNGAVLFDERYTANPLVFCGTVGLMPKAAAARGQQRPGDLVLLIGGRTGRDGIHGVNFASAQLTDRSTELSFTAVQIGNPIIEKRMIDTLMVARDRSLFRRITDCGGGGLSSAVGEMAEQTGVRVNLDRVPLKYSGLTYSEIWVSESQERMVLAVPSENIDEILKLFTGEGVEATVIGEFTDDHKLTLLYEGKQVANLEMSFLHHGQPRLELSAHLETPPITLPDFPPGEDLAGELKRALGELNTCSKEWLIRQYDHEVQAMSVLKPLVGASNDGPSDAAVIRPVPDSKAGLIIACGINPNYGDIDSYWMAASAIDEALRQVIAVGGSLERVALLDNFCWGNVCKPESLGALVRAAEACHDLSLAYGTPFISGKDSLNNEFQYQDQVISIPNTLLISAMAVMPDAGKAVSMDFKEAGNYIYLVGATYPELGGSTYLKNRGISGGQVPQVRPEAARKLMEDLSRATAVDLVRACHDLSEGGLGVSLAEIAFAGGLGANVNLGKVALGEPIERDDFILFAESNSRFLAEVAPENAAAFEQALAAVACARIGETTLEAVLTITGLNGREIVREAIDSLKEAWQAPLRW